MRLRTLVATGIVACASLATTYAANIDKLVVFGDSLSDNGNAAAALGGQFAYNGSSNYAPNAATDGKNTTPAIPAGGPTGLWIDQLATKLNLADPQPIISNVGGAIVPNFSGTNYAVAGASTGTNPAFNLLTLTTNPAIPYTADQVSIFNFFNASKADPNSLYVFWAGSNDIYAGGNPVTAANNVASNIQTLASEGAKNFVWVGEPDLGKSPAAVAAVAAGLVPSGAASAASAAYNMTQAADLSLLSQAGISVVPIDVNSLFNTLSLNTSTPAMGLAGVNPDDYAFWDGEHPTTEADSLIAALADQDLINAGLAPGLPGTATPEPAAFGFAALGLVGIAFRAVRRKA